jgi:predicted homoserine dehydrogenase-like protein
MLEVYARLDAQVHYREVNGMATAVGATVSREGFRGFEGYLQRLRNVFEPEDDGFDAMLERAVAIARANKILKGAS